MQQRHKPNWPIIAAIVLFGAVAARTEPPTKPDGTPSIRESELRKRFGEQQFAPQDGFVLRQGQKLPDLVWENPELVATVVEKTTIPTRWFNDHFEEVGTAVDTGHYYAYGEAPVPDGPVLRRAMTCCCVGKDLSLPDIARNQIVSQADGSHPEITREMIDALVRFWQSSEAGAVELAALLDSDKAPDSARNQSVRTGQWQMENATQHVRLKRELMGLGDKPLVNVTPRQLTGEPAPVLRNGALANTGISEEQREQIESKLDEWYAASAEPMAIVIAQHGVIVTAKSYGMVEGMPVTVDTPMSLDSAMKPLIGIQLATYVDRGHIKLDEPIGHYLPDFSTPQDRNLTFRAGHVHATGIHFPWELAFSRLFYFHTWHEALIAHCDREWAPGTRHRYGVVGVILSVRALELLRGRNYWDAMERDLFKPLGIRNVLPGGRGFSAESLARIGVLMDNRGKYGHWEFMSEETHNAILPTSLKPFFPDLDMAYGIGFQDESGYLGPGSYGHGGGCGTLLAINPKHHLVFAMVRNAQGKDFTKYRAAVTMMLREWINQMETKGAISATRLKSL